VACVDYARLSSGVDPVVHAKGVQIGLGPQIKNLHRPGRRKVNQMFPGVVAWDVAASARVPLSSSTMKAGRRVAGSERP